MKFGCIRCFVDIFLTRQYIIGASNEFFKKNEMKNFSRSKFWLNSFLKILILKYAICILILLVNATYYGSI